MPYLHQHILISFATLSVICTLVNCRFMLRPSSWLSYIHQHVRTTWRYIIASKNVRHWRLLIHITCVIKLHFDVTFPSIFNLLVTVYQSIPSPIFCMCFSYRKPEPHQRPDSLFRWPFSKRSFHFCSYLTLF
jgi:hypothetical protein